jgi:hypothetical protein
MDMMALGWRIIISMLARIEGMGIDVQVIRFQFSKNERDSMPPSPHLFECAAINPGFDLHRLITYDSLNPK